MVYVDLNPVRAGIAKVVNHEFGHTIGLQQQYNRTESFMSYSSQANFKAVGDDLKRLVDAYR